ISGATAATLQIQSAQATDAASYTVRISNSAGSVTSAAAVVSVMTPPSIIKSASGGTLIAGESLTLSVEASGTAPLQYQWFRDGALIQGATGPTLTLAWVEPSDAG